jgi:hypothetical protein
MVQGDRNKLFNAAYKLDNLTRIWLPKYGRDGLKVVSVPKLERLRMQGNIDDLCIVFTETELNELADELRELAANDESRVLRR